MKTKIRMNTLKRLQFPSGASAPASLAILLWGLLTAFPYGAHPQQTSVIFQEDFESGSFEAWDGGSDHESQRIQITSNPKHVYHGRKAVEFTIQPGGPKGATLNKWFLPGHQKIYARFYAKFAEGFNQGNLMHWVHVLGNRVDDKWSAFGQAGIRPTGDDFFTVGLEPWRAWGQNQPPGALMFYTYHMEMPQDPKTGKFWGENFVSDPPFFIQPGRWYGFELMVNANTPGQADGEQIAWIDSKKVIHTRGLRFRSTREVRINGFWLSLYLHDTPQTNTCWFDELVIAKKRVGLLEP